MSDILSYAEPKARKAHVCWWCGEPIEKGDQYVRWSWKDWGKIDTVKCHTECKSAWDTLNWMDRDCVSFGEACRGCTCAAGQCECGKGKNNV